MRETSVLEIIQNVEGSCDFGYVKDYPGEDMDEKRTNFWREVITSKASDSGFGHLVDSILEEGFHGSAIGWDENFAYITEGHHRLVAAILLFLDTVPTSLCGNCGTHRAREGMPRFFSAHNGCTVDTGIIIEA